MSDKTVNEIIGEQAREIEALKSLMAAYCEPIKEQIKERRQKIERLLVEDGRQLVADDLFEEKNLRDPE